MGKRTESLVFRFGVIFTVFTVVMLLLSGFAAYFSQNSAYKKERETSIQQVASYLEAVLTADGQDFAWYQDYFLSHSESLLVPHDFAHKDIQAARYNFEKLYAQKYGNLVLGADITFNELDDDVKAAFTVYKHEYYLNKFEQARERFNLIYVEYIVPTVDNQIIYTLDAMRDERIVDGKKYIELAISVNHDPAEHKKSLEYWQASDWLRCF